MASRLIVGCGYVGMRVAKRWLQQGDTVIAITRSQARSDELSQYGIQPIVWDWLVGGNPRTNQPLRTLSETEGTPFATILVSVSHAVQPNLPPEETHTRGLNHLTGLLESMGWFSDGELAQTKWIYLSTTGVFGPSSFSWVDEDSPVCPERPGSIAALAGERWMESHVFKDVRVTLRPAGIYGPDRVPSWQSIRDNTPLPFDPESYLNLIHADDLASTVVAVSTVKMQHSLYCVSDGEPVRRKEYYEFISKLGNWPEPVFLTSDLGATGSSSSRSGYKRVRSHRIRTELAIQLMFPSYREGLKSLLDVIPSTQQTFRQFHK